MIDRWHKVKISDELMTDLFVRDFQGNRLRVIWGELDAEGFQVPTIAKEYNDNIAVTVLHRFRHPTKSLDKCDCREWVWNTEPLGV